MTIIPSCHRKSLAVFICGKTSGKTALENGDYIDIYKRFLKASLESHTRALGASLKKASNSNTTAGPHPLWQFTLDPYDVVEAQEYPTEQKLDDYDGIFITGSPASAYENVQWINKLVAYTKHVADNKPNIKILGFCFGHQIVARALGGECIPNTAGWEVGTTPIALSDTGKRIFGVDEINLVEMHRDHVPLDRLPPSFQALGSTSRSGNQGMVRFLPAPPPSSSAPTAPSTSPHPSPDISYGGTTTPNATLTFTSFDEALPTGSPLHATLDRTLLSSIQILTVQGHPEWNYKVVTPLIEERAKSGILDMPTAEDAMRRQVLRNDGVTVVGSVVWSILGV